MTTTGVELIKARVRAGQYLVRSHAITHALKEGFEINHIVAAVLNGRIIEDYMDERALICGTAKLSENIEIYLHVVCEYADPFYVEFVTAYIPDELQWERPPYRRRKI